MKKLNAAFERMDEFKREHGRYTLEEAALLISEQTPGSVPKESKTN